MFVCTLSYTNLVQYFATSEVLQKVLDICLMFWTGQDDILGDIITDVYGPVSLVSKMGKSTFSVRAMTYCDLHKIKLDDLCQILQFYPEFAAEFLHSFRVTFNLRLQVIHYSLYCRFTEGKMTYCRLTNWKMTCCRFTDWKMTYLRFINWKMTYFKFTDWKMTYCRFTAGKMFYCRFTEGKMTWCSL